MDLNKNEQGLTAYDILAMPECPIKLPTARSMTQAAIDYNSIEKRVFEWYDEYRSHKPPTAHKQPPQRI